MLRIVPHTVPCVGHSYEHFPDGFELQTPNHAPQTANPARSGDRALRGLAGNIPEALCRGDVPLRLW